MKGFLRRTLENARGREQRLKPLTGSVYAGNYRRQDPQPGAWGEETINIPSASGAVPTSRQFPQPGVSQAAWSSMPETLLPARPDAREAAAGGHEYNRERQRPSSVFDSSVASSAAFPDGESGMRTASHSGVFEPPVPLLPPLNPGNSSSQPSNSQRNKGSGAETNVPQVPQGLSRAEKNQMPEEPRAASASPQRAEQQKVEPLLRPALAARAPNAGPQLSLPKNRPPQEPEIQVHIGRIEVIAAAPQPPRVSSPRPNRATSLADYLAGRNGRS
jgi:hypothetical protein